jgi:DNA-binding NarL/FixJ family response regulator
VTVTDSAPAPLPGHPTGPRVVLVDDHQLLAQSLALALQLEGVECRVAELADRDALVREVVDDPPDLVLLDLELGGAIGDGSTLVPAFVRAGCRVLVVSASTDQDQVCRALELGAIGAVRKDVAFTQLLDAALAAARGDQLISEGERLRLIAEARSRRSRRLEALAPFERLSAREAAVLRELAAGRSVGAIAGSWFVSEATVRSQVRAVLTKLGVTSQLEAVAQAHRAGWV